ncbi:oxidoreductase [Amycolatopsis acidicola]|uniref:Oxidoreductase n=1 Tax=Amycolatopsis acidicola TaxID=2596893 RepID=A0A5N0V3V5_9PSEU|nr:FAD-dependent oxidoreductase [Amycolatopsis acidicola]KAA9160474.1 oxidoreductase [Amycolatopsis acidicola]
MERLVVVGGGLAGHRALQSARKLGFTGELVLIGAERHKPYDRPPLSKQLLGAAGDPDRYFYDCADLADVDWQLGSPAVALDTGAQTIAVEDGRSLSYDKLVLATGRRARRWPGEVPGSGVFTIRDLDDSLALRASVNPGSRVVILGAGFIGMEVAATLTQRGVRSVSVLDVAPHPMPVLGPDAADRALRIHRRHGVDIRCGVTVSAIEGSARAETVLLADGTRLPADIVVVAIGSEPNTGWLADSGLELWRGNVRCDEYCRVAGVQNVVAAGDVAAWTHPWLDTVVSIEHWAIARDMAEIAVENILTGGAPRPMATIPTFWSDQYSVKIKSAGFLAQATSFHVVEESDDKLALTVEAFRDDQLVGAIVFNRNKTIIGYQRRLAGQFAGSR